LSRIWTWNVQGLTEPLPLYANFSMLDAHQGYIKIL
jgi:hypothetical protein